MYKIENGVLVISSAQDLDDYCKAKHITREQFDTPIKIADTMTDCSHLLAGCKKFNSSVEFDKNVRSCEGMFFNCESFNQLISVPATSGLNCEGMFCNCKSLTILPELSDNIYSIDPEKSDTDLLATLVPALIKTGRYTGGFSICRDMFRGCDNLQFDASIIPQGYSESHIKGLIGKMYENDSAENRERAIKSYEDSLSKVKSNIYFIQSDRPFNQPVPKSISDIPTVEEFNDKFMKASNVDSLSAEYRRRTRPKLVAPEDIHPCSPMPFELSVNTDIPSFIQSDRPFNQPVPKSISDIPTVEEFNDKFMKASNVDSNGFSNDISKKIENGVLLVSSRRDIDRYCEWKGITREEFDMPIKISDDMEDCSDLLRGCKKFNSSIEFGKSVKNCTHMLDGCEMFDKPVDLPDGVEICFAMFDGCKKFNQSMDIPDSVTPYGYGFMFNGCESLNSPIKLHEKALSGMSFMFNGCDSMELENIIGLPHDEKTVKKISWMFDMKNQDRLLADYQNNKASQAKCDAKTASQTGKSDIDDFSDIVTPNDKNVKPDNGNNGKSDGDDGPNL